MSNLTTKYMGFNLKNPIVCSSSPLCDDLDALRRMEDSGAAAVVLRSLFEEQLELESMGLDYRLSNGSHIGAEAPSYFPDMPTYNLGPDGYLDHIRRAKEQLAIPVIASLNGVSPGGWIQYSKLIEQAGADGLELNLYDIPTDPRISAGELEDGYVSLVQQLNSIVSIPLAVKLSPFFTSPAAFGVRLSEAGADALVLFNRFYQPDLDLETLDVVPRLHLSQSNELPLRLHWTAILFDHVKADIGITGGVHSPLDVLKCMMVGARVAMLTSALLTHGIEHLTTLLNGVHRWLDEHEYPAIQPVQGCMSLRSIPDPRAYERGNYMKVLQSWILQHDSGSPVEQR